jgi:hypothetical protein
VLAKKKGLHGGTTKTATKIVLTHRKKPCYVEVHVLADCRVAGWCKNSEQKWMVRVTTATKLVLTQHFKKKDTSSGMHPFLNNA